MQPKKSKITRNTVNKCLGCPEDSFLIEAARRYGIRGKARMEPPKKYCFSDLGLRNARLSSRQQEPDRALGSVACDGLRRRGYGVDIGVVTCAEKDSDNKAIRKQPEADFVCNPASSRCYARSAYAPADEAKRRQDARPLLRTDDPLRKIVMTKDAVKPFHDDHGILTVSVCDFPLDPRPLESLP